MVIIPGKKKNLAKRFYSNVIDYCIFFLLMGGYIFLAGEESESGRHTVTGFKALVIPVLWLLYFPTCEALFGQTVGKRAFHLFVTDMKGETPTIVQAFGRRFLDLFEMMFFGIPALIIINYTEKNQRIGDLIAQTTVVRNDAVCRFCGAELELLPKEILRDSFTCPNCNEKN